MARGFLRCDVLARLVTDTQAFRIKVEPDVQEQPMSMDISSVVSKPITVLSKRINKPGKNKRTSVGGSVKRAAGESSEFHRRCRVFVARCIYFLRGPAVDRQGTLGAFDYYIFSL